MMVELNDLMALMRSRRAIRRYEDRPVPDELLEQLLEAAVWAPSAHNRQPWRFAVLTQWDDKARLARAMGDKLRHDRTADGDPPEDIERDVQRSFRRITGAPVVIVVCLSMADMDVYADERRSAAEKQMAVQSVAMAAQNLWLLAHGAGLGCCWLCAPLFVPKLVGEVLGLPNDWEPQGLMTLGWPAQNRTKTRQPLHTRVKFFSKKN
ncbi:MAG: nitroreductase family protein [Ardenticatenaceae bacterium]|nr:nitroreductase family protein [Ardenticatenaceae bacterium]